MLRGNSGISYSRDLATKFNRTLAVGLFAAARFVFRLRSGYGPIGFGPAMIFDRYAIRDVDIASLTDLTEEQAFEVLRDLTNAGVLDQFVGVIEGHTDTYFIFRNEHGLFPKPGECQMLPATENSTPHQVAH